MKSLSAIIKLCCSLIFAFCVLYPICAIAIEDIHNIESPVSKYQIQIGTLIPITLVTGINLMSEGDVYAQVRDNIYDTETGKHLLIPKGSRLAGKYLSQADGNHKKALITFYKIIRPNGSQMRMGNPNTIDSKDRTDTDKNIHSSWASMADNSTISTILSVGAGRTSTNNDHSNQTVSITLEPGHKLNVVVKKDMALTIYRSKAH